jgi:precorrin-4/cobalt-precorrin-4 C11-methyltransferase
VKVYFVGAGPGDPELITLKGKAVIERCPVIIYAGSLVNPAILSWARPGAAIHDSASMTLDEVVAVISKAHKEGHDVARVHSGDPAIYGAIAEQMQRLDELGIEYEVVPGVSSFLASAAALRKELTAPGVTQTIILTRMGGRTPAPAREDLEHLARIGATLVIFLSVDKLRDAVGKLAPGYGYDTPVRVVYRASWPDQKTVEGTLADIADKVEASGITKTALILVGRALAGTGEASRLYDKTFSHGFRKATP